MASSSPSPSLFSTLNLVKPLLDALSAEGYITPTPIQARAIPPALEHRDVLGIAQTGTGKTAAFALPILQHLLAGTPSARTQPRTPRALVLAPTRELAAQIGASFAAYGRGTSIRHVVIFGGVGQRPQVDALRNGVDIIVATPGRLTDLMQQRVVDLRSISFVVLDEADRMLDMGFIDPIRRIMGAVPGKRQTMLFSATMPDEIKHLADSFMRDPVRVAVTPVASTVDRVTQHLYQVPMTLKTQLLLHVLGAAGVERALVFTKTKHGADRVVKRLHAAGVVAQAIHGNKAQSHRTRALEAFRSGAAPVLVATDIAARGIDVDGITHVINFDLPMEPESYVHRIGRTARAGASGIAIAFCSPEERMLLRGVERLIRQQIPVLPMPKDLPQLPQVAAASPGQPRHHTPRGRNAPRSPHGAHASKSGHSQRHGNSASSSHSSGQSHASGSAHAPRPAHAHRGPSVAGRAPARRSGHR
ncbi:MAG: DEAD/DEAH box helicase [Phycisphaerales bacterium]|nr:DEAD/DEAH box helicase [Phycisphaerales bacterium]